jgi:hypothetical protein
MRSILDSTLTYGTCALIRAEARCKFYNTKFIGRAGQSAVHTSSAIMDDKDERMPLKNLLASPVRTVTGKIPHACTHP